MSEKRPIKENQFDTGIAGSAGASNYAAGWGTHASPEVSQNSANFAHSDNNKAVNQKALGSTSNTTTGMPASGSNLDGQVDQLYAKSDTPSPDEVMTGLKYEMQNMIKKDKARAKEIVLSNLQQDPHYYGRLGMWNIDDKEMMNVEPPKKADLDPMKERIDLLNKMWESRRKKEETPQILKDALKETRARRDARYTR